MILQDEIFQEEGLQWDTRKRKGKQAEECPSTGMDGYLLVKKNLYWLHHRAPESPLDKCLHHQAFLFGCYLLFKQILSVVSDLSLLKRLKRFGCIITAWCHHRDTLMSCDGWFSSRSEWVLIKYGSISLSLLVTSVVLGLYVIGLSLPITASQRAV